MQQKVKIICDSWRKKRESRGTSRKRRAQRQIMDQQEMPNNGTIHDADAKQSCELIVRGSHVRSGGHRDVQIEASGAWRWTAPELPLSPSWSQELSARELKHSRPRRVLPPPPPPGVCRLSKAEERP